MARSSEKLNRVRRNDVIQYSTHRRSERTGWDVSARIRIEETAMARA
jgi:hypothetical protein